MNCKNVTPVCLVLLLTASPAFGAATVETLVKSRFSGLGKVVNVFGGKAAREGLPVRTSQSGDRRVVMTGRDVEVIDLGDEMIWRYKVNKKGKPGRKCQAVTFEEFREQMAALKDLPFFGGDGQERPAQPADGAPPPLEYELTLKWVETEQEETHAGMTGSVYQFEAIAHRPGLPVEEGGGILEATFVVGPKNEAWNEMQAWNEKWAELIGEMTGIGTNLYTILEASPALQKVMAELRSKQTELDGPMLRTTTRLSTVADPRARQQAQTKDDGDVPTSLGGLGAKIGGAFLKGKQDDAAAKKPKEQYTSEVTITGLSDEADALLELPDSCKK